MSSRLMSVLIAWSACLGFCTSLTAASPASQDLTLLGRSTERTVQAVFDPSQVAWLHSRSELILGTSAPDYPPFDMTASGHDYEGFTADYAMLVGQATGLPIRVKRFSSREAAIRALIDGHIDMLGTSNGFEAENTDIVLSRPYAIDQPVLVTREGETRTLTEGLAGNGMRRVMAAVPQAIVAYSCDKNFGLYRDRVGAVYVMMETADQLGPVMSNGYALARAAWSMPLENVGS